MTQFLHAVAKAIADKFNCEQAVLATFKLWLSLHLSTPSGGWDGAGDVFDFWVTASAVIFKRINVKGLILAQNERWRRGLGMQVEREPPAREGKVAKGAVMHG